MNLAFKKNRHDEHMWKPRQIAILVRFIENAMPCLEDFQNYLDKHPIRFNAIVVVIFVAGHNANTTFPGRCRVCLDVLLNV